MNIINKGFLKLALLPAGIYSRMGVNLDQLRSILHVKLTMDDRRPNSIQQTRRQLTEGLVKLGFYVYPSQANFVMARRKGQEQKALHQALRERKIYVRYFDTPELRDSLRITVGTPEDVERLLQEIAAIQKESVDPSQSGGSRI